MTLDDRTSFDAGTLGDFYDRTIWTGGASEQEETLAQEPPLDGGDGPATGNRRRRWPFVVAALALVLVVAGAVGAWALHGPIRDARYVSDLTATGLADEYASRAEAVAHGRSFCDSLGGGEQTQGFRAEQVAVQHYCPQFADGFVVVPTPAERLAAFTADLRGQGLGGLFGSDREAQAYAEGFCERLASGSPNQGLAQDQIAVRHYCADFSTGFKLLRTIEVTGSFTLRDSYPGIYFPSIVSSGAGCEGDNGYSDIHPGTTVLVKNGAGDLLASTTLGTGRGGYTECRLPFSFEVTEGEDDYVISVSHRGELHYTFAQLDIGDSVDLGLGE